MVAKKSTPKEENTKEAEIKRNIAKTLKKGVFLMCTTADNYVSSKRNALLYLTNELKMKGVYITLNKPSKHIMQSLKEADIEIERMRFIDCIGKTVGICEDHEHCLHLESPKALTKLSFVLFHSLNSGGVDFLYFDSITTLLAYNNSQMTYEFLHNLISKMRDLNIHGLLVAVEEEKTRNMIPILTQLCDGIIKM